MSETTETSTEIIYDLGHRSDFDYTQIARSLSLIPEERLERHEGWRFFVKEALRNAAIRQGNNPRTGSTDNLHSS
jgi:hypothetical protein